MAARRPISGSESTMIGYRGGYKKESSSSSSARDITRAGRMVKRRASRRTQKSAANHSRSGNLPASARLPESTR